MEGQPHPPPGSCVAKNSQRPASVETVQGGVPPYGVKETLVVVVVIVIIINIRDKPYKLYHFLKVVRFKKLKTIKLKITN